MNAGPLGRCATPPLLPRDGGDPNCFPGSSAGLRVSVVCSCVGAEAGGVSGVSRMFLDVEKVDLGLVNAIGLC